MLKEHDATLVRALADDLVALFDDGSRAIDAAFEMLRRIAHFNGSALAQELRYRKVVLFQPLALGTRQVEQGRVVPAREFVKLLRERIAHGG